MISSVSQPRLSFLLLSSPAAAASTLDLEKISSGFSRCAVFHALRRVKIGGLVVFFLFFEMRGWWLVSFFLGQILRA